MAQTALAGALAAVMSAQLQPAPEPPVSPESPDAGAPPDAAAATGASPAALHHRGHAGPPRPEPVRHVDVDRPMVALTFDACATKRKSYGFDRGVYDALKADKVPATIFASGRWLSMHP